jgi:hypothetical protein
MRRSPRHAPMPVRPAITNHRSTWCNMYALVFEGPEEQSHVRRKTCIAEQSSAPFTNNSTGYTSSRPGSRPTDTFTKGLG